jgi:hypothetical protein
MSHIDKKLDVCNAVERGEISVENAEKMIAVIDREEAERQLQVTNNTEGDTTMNYKKDTTIDVMLEKLANTAGSRNYMEGILEDGRPKEAYRSTSLSDIDEEEIDGIIDQVIKEQGPDADEMELISDISDRIRGRFFEKERSHAGEDPVYGALYKNLLDDSILDDVYRQTLDDDYMGLNDRILDKFYGN